MMKGGVKIVAQLFFGLVINWLITHFSTFITFYKIGVIPNDDDLHILKGGVETER